MKAVRHWTEMKRTAVIVGLLFGLLDFILWLSLPVHYGGNGVSLQISEGGSPGKITFIVLDTQQQPMPQIKVVSASYSGTTPFVVTDASGHAVIDPAESEVTAVEIGGRWFGFENRFLPLGFEELPSCTQGLTIKATIKKR